MTVSVLWPFIMMSWAGLQCVIVVFHDLTNLLFTKVSTQLYFEKQQKVENAA